MNIVMSHTGQRQRRFGLALFPGLPLSSLLLAVCKDRGERAGPFYHVNDVSVYLEGWGRSAPQGKFSNFEVLRLLLVASETH